MKLETRLRLETVFTYPFFKSIGQSVLDPVTIIGDWKIAINHFSSRKWQNCRLMARNVLQRTTERQSWERSEQWNLIADELRPLIGSFVDTLESRAAFPPEMAEQIKPSLSWDIMFICFECEYKDLAEPLFYIPILEPWYAAGHLPCGWDGKEFPDGWDGVIRDGRLMVF